MLTPAARTAVSKMLEWGCWIGIYPYSWDPHKFRLGPQKRVQMVIYHIRRHFVMFMWVWNVLRVAQTASAGNLPARLRVMNVSYIFGWFLVNLCYHQFQTKRGALQFCINSLFEEVDRQRDLKIGKPEDQEAEEDNEDHQQSRRTKEVHTDFNWVSWMMIFSTFLLFLNPFTHAMPTIDVPCAPQYLGSVMVGCQTPMDDPVPWHLKIVFFVVETWLMSDIMFTYSFNSNLFFMGMTWVQQELQRYEGNHVPGKRRALDMGKVETQYRRAQVLLALFNDAFRTYLSAFPSLLFLISGIYLFGTFRYAHLPFYAYWVFPTCTFRCFFEATSALTAAGFVNSESKLHLTQWDRELDRIGRGHREERKYLRAFRRSCSDLKCMAGSLYSFENSIVLVSLSNTILLTMNLFVTFKNS